MLSLEARGAPDFSSFSEVSGSSGCFLFSAVCSPKCLLPPPPPHPPGYAGLCSTRLWAAAHGPVQTASVSSLPFDFQFMLPSGRPWRWGWGWEVNSAFVFAGHFHLFPCWAHGISQGSLGRGLHSLCPTRLRSPEETFTGPLFSGSQSAPGSLVSAPGSLVSALRPQSSQPPASS